MSLRRSLPDVRITMLAITLACGLLVWFAPSALSSSVQDDSTTLLVAQDADGDGLGDTVDPDDDNDGIVDSEEGNPTQSGPGGNGSAPPDADGDGIGDVLDPDDDNNAVTDNEEPVGGPSSQPPEPNTSPGNPATNEGRTSAGTDSGQILALPVTGSHPYARGLGTGGQLEALLASFAAVCMLGVVYVRRQKRSKGICAS